MDEQLITKEEQEQQLKNELLFTLSERDTGTVALIVTSNEKQRHRLQFFLKEHLQEYQFYNLDLTPYSYTSLSKALDELLPPYIKNATATEWVINITGLENALYKSEDGKLEYTALVSQLNFERELLFKQQQILILWTNKSFYSELKKKAPDLMHWLSKRFVFDEDNLSPEVAEAAYQKGKLQNKGKTRERTQRISELEATWEKLCLDHNNKERLLKDKINILLLLGKEYREAFDFAGSEEALKKALGISERIQHKQRDEIAFQLGNTYYSFNKLDLALLYYQQSLLTFINEQNERYLGNLYHNIGAVYANQGKWQDAIANFQKAIEYKMKTGDEFELGITYHEIGRVYENQGKWQEALSNYQQAIDWYKKTGNDFHFCSTYHQIGKVYEEQNDNSTAKYYFTLARANAEKFNHHHKNIIDASLKRLEHKMTN